MSECFLFTNWTKEFNFISLKRSFKNRYEEIGIRIARMIQASNKWGTCVNHCQKFRQQYYKTVRITSLDHVNHSSGQDMVKSEITWDSINISRYIYIYIEWREEERELITYPLSILIKFYLLFCNNSIYWPTWE